MDIPTDRSAANASSATPPIVLASTSRYRRALLERLGLPFEARPPGVDEAPLPGETPRALAERLAVAKAEALAESVAAELGPEALIIGSDQVVDLDGEVLGKPGSAERAVDQLARMAGRSHRLVTAMAVHQPASGRTEQATDIHILTMRPLSRAALARYVAHDAPIDCAGAYMLERRGIALFERIEADEATATDADGSAIIGLPMVKTLALLGRFGFEPL